MLNFLFGPKNPTIQWPPYTGQALTFDLDAGSLNGVRLGERLGSLSFLGPSAGRRLKFGNELRYHSLGVCAECYSDDETISGFRTVFADPEDQQYRPFAGEVISRGRAVDLSAMTPDGFVQEFGECYWTDRDEDESIMFYEFGNREWQVEHDLDSQLNCITVTTPPLMADEKQRKLFGVTKAWPPA